MSGYIRPRLRSASKTGARMSGFPPTNGPISVRPMTPDRAVTARTDLPFFRLSDMLFFHFTIGKEKLAMAPTFVTRSKLQAYLFWIYKRLTHFGLVRFSAAGKTRRYYLIAWA